MYDNHTNGAKNLYEYQNQLLDTARKAFASNKTKDVRFRKKQLKQLDLLLQENRDVICDALRADLHKVDKLNPHNSFE